MKWPWISRAQVDAQATLNRLLQKELDYYRIRYEGEKERADRAVDALVQWCGREPISVPSREVQESRASAIEQMQSQMAEICGDVAGSILREPEGDEDTEIVPEGNPLKSIAERLEVLRILPRSRAVATGSSQEVSPQDTINK